MADNLVKALSQENLRQIINILMTMNKSDESTGVKVYTNGEEYLKNDIVVYLQENATDYTLLICTTSHTSSTDVPDMINFATVDSTIIENFTDDEIAELFDLSEEEAVELTKLIDDVHIAINKVYSNQRIEERLTEILAEANEYATKLLGNTNFLTVEIVTSESEVTSNNVLYLIDDGLGTNTYNQFILVDGAIKSLGSTSIDLSNYHTKEEITTLLADYAKKNEVLSSDNIVTAIDDTVTNAQVVGALTVKEELDKKIDKNNIATSVDGTTTHEQVLSAKLYYDEKNTMLIIGAAPEHRGQSLIDIIDAKCTKNFALYHVVFNSLVIDKPDNESCIDGFCDVYTYTADLHKKIIVHDVTRDGMYERTQFKGVWGDWVTIFSRNNDVPKTNMTSASSSYHFNDAFYTVINNMCYVTLSVKVIVSEPSHTVIFALPKPKVIIEQSTPPLGTGGNSIHYGLNESGLLFLLYGDVGKDYIFSFSYPVASE